MSDLAQDQTIQGVGENIQGDQTPTPVSEEPSLQDHMASILEENGTIPKDEAAVDQGNVVPIEPIVEPKLESEPETTSKLRKLGDPDENATQKENLVPEEAEATQVLDEDLEGLDERTKNRFRKLADQHKETEKNYEQVNTRYTKLSSLITDVATPEEFAQALDYFRAIKSGDTAKIQGALSTLNVQREILAKAIGQDVPGVDQLSDFPDLRQKVDDVAITEQDAIEIAHSRRTIADSRANQQQFTQQQQQGAQWETRVNSAANNLNTVEAQLRAKDPDFDACRKIMTPQLNNIASNVPPERWAESYEEAYKAVKSALASTRQGNQNRAQPIAQPGTNVGPIVPKTLEEAMLNNFGLS